MGDPPFWIMRSLLKHTFWDASDHFSRCILNMERSRWVCGFLSIFDRLRHFVILSPGLYISLDIHHVNIFGRVVIGSRGGSLTVPFHAQGC
jgi:hypothetical protein